MNGVVTNASNPENVHKSVVILAETVGDTTAVAIRMDDLAFGGAGFIIAHEMLFLFTILILAI